MVYNQNINLDLDTRSPSLIIGAKQYDNNSRTITATILENGKIIDIPSNALASYRIQKPNGKISWQNAPIDYANSAVKITLRAEDLSVSGRNIVDVVLTIGSFTLGTTNFILDIQAAPNINNIENDSNSIGHLEEMIRQADNIIEDAQAWAEGKRGDSPVVSDNYTVGAPSGLNVTLNFDTFKSQITPKTAGATITYTFTYTSSGWMYNYDTSIVDMSTLGFSIVALAENSPVLGDLITVVASYTDAAYQNNAKYYAEVAASAAVSLTSNIASINSAFNNKLDVPVSQSSPPSNPKVGDFWVDNDAQFVLVGAVVGSSNIQPNSILSSHIGAQVIQTAHMSNGIVTSSILASGAVTNVAISNSAISSNHLASSIIYPRHLSNNVITSAAIANGAIYRDHIADGAVRGLAIESHGIQNHHMGYGVIEEDNIKNSAIRGLHLQDEIIALRHMDPDFIDFVDVPGGRALIVTSPELESEVDGTIVYTRQDAFGYILFTGGQTHGLVCYNIIKGSSTGTTFIGYRAAATTTYTQTLAATGASLILSTENNNFQLVNKSATNTMHCMVIKLNSQVELTVY